MKITQAIKTFKVSLEEHSPILTSEIQRLTVKRPFIMNESVSKDAIDAIHFEYEWDSYQPVAIPLNTGSGYCGQSISLESLANLIPSAVESALDDAMDDEDDDFGDELREAMTNAYVAWFKATWQAVSCCSSNMRGFLSVHDTIWRTDLDTGEKFREDLGTVKFFQ